MKIIKTAVFLILAWTLSTSTARACTVFVLDDGDRHYYGSNYDWHIGLGHVLVNPRGLYKQGWVVAEDPGRPARWRSRYGSVTFVQYGRGLPKGGMNEAGLVIEGLMLLDTEYPQADQRPYIGSSAQFKQYLLDTCATVGEAVERAAHVRLTVAYAWAPGVHFMVADATGDCAVLAYLDGRLKVYRGPQLPVKVLTNHAYAGHLTPVESVSAPDLGFSTNSTTRFDTAARRLADHQSASGAENLAYALETLTRVAAGPRTQWQQVYDQAKTVVYWRTHPHQGLRWLDLKKIDFTCRRTIRGLSVQAPVVGEANAHLVPLAPEANHRLVREALAQSRHMIPAPEGLWEKIASWPEQETCSGP